MSPGTLSWVLHAIARLRPGGYRLRERLRVALEECLVGRGARIPDPDEVSGCLAVDRALRDEARRVLETCREAGVDVLVPGGPGYPARLLVSDDPPAALFVRGEPRALAVAGVAVLGSRRVTASARGWARSLGRLVVGASRVLVAGFTSVVEQDAVRGAAAVPGGASVVCVLPYGPFEGLTRVAVEDLEAVFSRGGALVTRIPPGHSGVRGAHQARDHLVAGLSGELVVVQAGAGSGVLDTARYALEAGRRVRVARLSPGSPLGAGGRALVRDGAEELCRPVDLVDPAGRLGELLPAPIRHLENAGPVAPDRLLGTLDSRGGGEIQLERLLTEGWLTWTGDGRLAADYLPLLERLKRPTEIS